MIAGLRMRSGEVWGAVSMYREFGSPMFDADDLRFIQAVALPPCRGSTAGPVGRSGDPP